MSEPDFANVTDERFVGLLVANQRRIYSFILTLLPNLNDADDILQETSIILWRKSDEFEPGTNFCAWAFRIARFVVQNHYAKQTRSKVRFDSSIEDSLVALAAEMSDEMDARSVALKYCVKEMSATDQDLLQRRYEAGATVKQIAEQVGRPLQGLYKAMQRIHRALFVCVNQRMTGDS